MFKPVMIDSECFRTLYKDVHGLNPRKGEWRDQEHFDNEFHLLQSTHALEMQAEEARFNAAVASYSALISALMLQHSIDKQTAIRWDMQAEDAEDADHYRYLKNLPFGFDIYS